MRPAVVVVLDRGAAMPWEIVDAAGEHEIVFLLNRSSPHSKRLADAASADAETHIVGSVAEAVDVLGGVEVRGVVTFSDSTLLLASGIAAASGVRFHDCEVALALADKAHQRERLRRGGVRVPVWRPVTIGRDVADAAGEIGYPVILKPRRSCESRNTYRLVDGAAASAAASIVETHSGSVGGFVVEEIFVGDPGIAGTPWGDYVSVESAVANGEITHLAVLGKFPLVEPFRETGQFLPSTLRTDRLDEARDTAEMAITALGVRDGLCHTEVKLTAAGPRVIEVNGRLGGAVEPLAQAACGESLVRLAIGIAVGDGPKMIPGAARALAESTLTYQIKCYAEATTGEVANVRGLAEVRTIEGVRTALATKRPGDRVDESLGGASDIVHVYGSAPDHDALAAVFKQVNSEVSAQLIPGER